MRIAYRMGLVALAVLAACATPENHGDSTGKLQIPLGEGLFLFQSDTLNSGRPLTVFSYRPQNYSDSSPIVFVIHGSSRNPETYREPWEPVAEEHGALILCPYFGREVGFPTAQEFNMGNMFKMDSLDHIVAPKPKNEWAYTLIDAVFDYVVRQLGNFSQAYYIFGHSAGSQFVHRMLFFCPEAKVLTAACANAGWYTMPDFETEFPYGFKGTGYDPENLRTVFAKDVVVLLGDQDTDTQHRSLRRTPEAMRQGPHRFARGQKFYAYCKQVADSLGFEFNWRLRIVPGVAHSNRGMMPAAAEEFFGRKP